MRHSLIKKRRYYFTDDSTASDTIIAFVMAGISLATEVAGFVASIITKGSVPGIFGVLYICAIILSLCGVFFALLGYRAQEGGITGKRMSVFLNIVTAIIPVITLISGFIK